MTDKKEPPSFHDLAVKGTSPGSVGLQCVTIKHWLPTGCPQLDHALRPGHPPDKQGLPGGKWAEILGEEGTGKTALACRFGRSCQSLGGHVVYLGAEGGSMTEFLTLCGLSLDPEYFTPVYPFSLESCFQAIENIIEAYHDQQRPVLMILDSLSGLEASDYTMDGKKFKESTPQAAGAKATHKMFRRGMLYYMQGSPIWGVVIRHETGSPKSIYEGGGGVHATHGKALNYYTWVRLRTKSKSFEDKYGGKAAGAFLSATVIKSKIGPKYGHVSIPFYAGWGWDLATEQIQYLMDAKAFKAGNGSGYWNYRGQNLLTRQIRDLYYNDPGAKTELDSWVQIALMNGGVLPK